jgi:hypothetical protein
MPVAAHVRAAERRHSLRLAPITEISETRLNPEARRKPNPFLLSAVNILCGSSVLGSNMPDFNCNSRGLT